MVRPMPPIIAATCCPSSNSPPGAAATTPVASMPSTRGNVTPCPRPSLVCNSERLIPNALTRMSTQPGRGSGTGSSRIRSASGGPGASSTTARMVAVMGPRLSAKRAVDGDLGQSVLENGELLIVELREEQFRDPAQVDRSGFGEARHAGVGQGYDDTACVRIGVGSPDETFLDQPGHPAGHARPRDERPGRELRHAELTSR